MKHTLTRLTQKGLGKTFCPMALPLAHPCLRKSHLKLTLTAVACSLALAACGGGGGGDVSAVTTPSSTLPDTTTPATPTSPSNPASSPSTGSGGYVVTTITGYNSINIIGAFFGSQDGPAGSATFSGPQGIAMGPDGSLYVADTGNGKIRKIANGTVSTVAGVGGAPEHSDSNPNIFNLVDGPCAGAYFSGPSGIAVDQSGTIYVAEKGSNVIRKITNPDTDACTVSTLAGEPYNYQAGWEYADGTGSNARFYSPRNLILDAAGNLYVTDYGNYAIRKVTPEGVVTTLASNHDLFNTNYQFNHPDTTPVTAGGVDSPLINRPNGIIMDGNGNLYVGNDSEFNSIIDIGANILQVTPDGTASVFFTHYSGNGGLTIGADGALYVTHGYAIEQITMNGAQDTTFAGDFYNGGWRDGAADQSLFSSPVGLFADASGAIYVADTGNNMIRKIAPAQ